MNKKNNLTVAGKTITGTAEDIMDAVNKATDKFNSQQDKLVVITKASIKTHFCKYSYRYVGGVTEGDEIDRTGSLLIHDDMVNAFKKLGPHLAVICEEIDPKLIHEIEDIEEYDEEVHKKTGIEFKMSHFSVHSFILSGTGDSEAVTINGHKMLSDGEYVGLKSPAKKFSGEYVYINELRVAIDECIQEVERYMAGKSQPKMMQPELPGLTDQQQNESI